MNDGVIRRPGIRAAIDPRMMGRYRLEAWALRAALAAFRAIGLDAASALGGLLGRSIGPRIGRTRTARRNIGLAFPDMGEAEIGRVITAMWDNLGRTAAEYAHLDKIHAGRPGGRIELVGTEHVDDACAAGRSVIFVSGHFANWELLGRCSSQYGLDVGAVYRAPNNPIVHDWLSRMRAELGTPIQFAKGRDGARALIAHLAAGGHVAMLIDQKLNDGIPAPLLGREAMTSPAAAQLALKYGCVILPATIERLGGARFRVSVHPPVALERTADRAADIAAATAQLNDILGEWIRACPGQWLWIHNRWPK